MPKKAPERIGSVLRVPLSQLHPHPQNPFAVRDDCIVPPLVYARTAGVSPCRKWLTGNWWTMRRSG